MDLISDNLSVSDLAPGGEIVDNLGNIAKNFMGSIAHKAQLKSGLSYIASGDLSKLTGAQLDRLIEANTPAHLYTKSPVYIARWNDPNQGAWRTKMIPIVAADTADPLYNPGIVVAKNANGTNTNVPVDIKKYIPWILGAIVV